MYTAMAEALASARDDAEVRAVLFTGTGDAFTSGNDLKDFVSAPPAGPESPVFRFLTALATHPQPVVAAVNGLAIGIGTTVLLHCDLAVADPAARFSLPFINLGLVPEAASSLLLPRMLGHQRAAELLLLGEMFDAPTALRHGIVTRLSAPGACESDAMALAQTLARKAPMAMRASKALLKADGQAVVERIAAEGVAFATQLRSPEFAEAVAAFMEKRTPHFS
jgi:enoyl-CoA hydratase/carnithine racemase